jgi:hypothetical protein
MSRFTCREFHNIESELDLWVRGEIESGRSEAEVLQDLIISMDSLMAAHQDDVLDDIPTREMSAYDEGYRDGKQFERARLSLKSQPILAQ